MRRAALLAAAAACMHGCGEERNYNFGVPGSSMGSASSASEPAAGAAVAAGDASESAAAAPMGAPERRAEAPRAASTRDLGAPSASGSASSVPAESTSSATADPTAGSGATAGVAAEEPFKVLARDSRFDEFRGMSARYMQLRRELYPLGLKLADGSATDDDRKRYYALEARVEEAWRPVNAYMWNDRWSEEDRAAMGWILYAEMQPPRS